MDLSHEWVELRKPYKKRGGELSPQQPGQIGILKDCSLERWKLWPPHCQGSAHTASNGPNSPEH